MTEATAFVRRIVADAWLFLRTDWQTLAIITAIYAGLSIATDELLVASAAGFANAVLGLLASYFQLLVTFRMLYLRGAAPADHVLTARTEARFTSVIALSFLAGIPILLGLLLLAVPGLILALLWSVAMPALAAERLGASKAMARSWALVRPNFGRAALLGTGVVGTIAALIAVLLGIIDLEPATERGVMALGEVLFPGLLLFNAAIWTAAYLDLRNGAQATT